MPKSTEERIIDRPYDLSLRRGTSSPSSSGGSGGSGIVYTAGTAIDIDGSSAISVKIESASAITVGGGGGIQVDTGDGLQISSNAITLNLDTDPGLEYNSGALRVKLRSGYGLTRDSNGVYVNLATDPGLEFSSGLRVKLKSGMTAMTRDSNGIYIADAIAGDGLSINSTTKVMAVSVGDGLDIVTDAVAVDVTDFIDTSYGLTESSNNIRINLATNSGMAFATGALGLGTPTTLTYATTNAVTASTHSHAVTASSNVGASPAQSLLKSDASGNLTLAQLSLYGNLVFAGGNRSITASNNLTISPSTDLILDPTGLISMPNAQEFRTSTINDLPTGIDGMRVWNRYANYNQLNIGAIKADELYVRVFVADGTRIDLGERYMGKSYGIVQEDFTLPAVSATVDVWFEDVPGATGFDIFANGDYLLCRQIEWGTGLIVQKIWFQVAAAKLDQETTAIDGVDRQQWRLERIAGGVDSSLIKRGNVMLDSGQVGQGWIHFSALEQDGGPFIQMGEFTSVSTVPQFTNYVRMGNLNGTVDYSSDTYGFATGDSLGTLPSAGFSGATTDSTNGLRLFNTSIQLYRSGTLDTDMTAENGLRFQLDTGAISNPRRYISWSNSLTPYSDDNDPVKLGAYNGSGYTIGLWSITRGDLSNASTGVPLITLYTIDSKTGSTESGAAQLLLSPQKFRGLTSGLTPFFNITTAGKSGFGLGLTTPASTGHFYEDTTAVTTAAGVTIEQDGTGDAVVQWLLTGGRRWMAGIDNSVTDDPLVFSPNGNLSTTPTLAMLSSGYVGIGNVAPAYNLHVSGLALIERTLASTNGFAQVLLVKAKTTLNMTDPFGVSLSFRIEDTAAVENIIGLIGARRNGADNSGDIVLTPYVGGVEAPSTRITKDGRLGVAITSPASIGHFYQNDTATTSAAGVTIEQDGTGDAVTQYLLTGGTRWITGIDNSDSDKYKITAGSDLGSSPAVTITTGGSMTVDGDIDANGDISTLGDVLAFDNVVAATGDIVASAGDITATSGNVIAGARIGVGGITSPGAFVDVAGNAAVDLAPMVRASFYGTGTSRYNFLGRRARTSFASPTAIQDGDVIMSLGGLGYTSSGWSSSVSGQVTFSATENYTGSGRGAKMTSWVTQNGSSSPAIAMELGDARQALLPGVYVHTTGGGANVNVDSSGWLRLVSSSRRYKTDIRPLPSQSALFDRLEPVLYKPAEGVGGGDRDYPGLIAESVAEAGGHDYVTFDDEGRPQSIMYDRLVILTIAELQQMKQEIADLRERVMQL